MKRRWVCLYGLVLTANLFFTANTLEADPSLEIDVRPSKTVKIGSDWHFTLSAVWRVKEADYQFQEPVLPLNNLEIRETGEATEVFVQEGEKWKKKSFRFILTPTKKGRGSIRPFRVAYLDPVTQRGGALKVGPVGIEILPDHSQLYRNLILFFVFSGGIGVLSLAFYFGFRRRANIHSKPIPPLEEHYLIELQPLQGVLEGSTAHRLQISKADKTLRAYLKEKLSIREPVMTNRELVDKHGVYLSALLTREDMASLCNLITKLEEGSFAGSDPSGPEVKELVLRVKQFIEARKPIPAGQKED